MRYANFQRAAEREICGRGGQDEKEIGWVRAHSGLCGLLVFGCNPSAEDEPDLSKVYFRFDLYETYLRGYLSAVGDTITAEERKNLPTGAVLMTYECGMRFLTDYLEGDVYFRTTRAQQNLDRARTQFKLVDDMLAVLDKMERAASR